MAERRTAVSSTNEIELIDDMRQAFPKPSDSDITRLRILVQRVRDDPASAAKYTTGAKEAPQEKSACRKIQSFITGGDLCSDRIKPGFD